ncbi:hypothetical protein E4U43_000915 [Claviceps pusilla]|uniref:Endosomal/vacuolar adapter protein YPT35 n=1 Tax=Claviceps pusilla TaxID=123648 RepID=A0A9P7N968_9HYPO|nr:hypothetical protein E4U43_000915 [Claviceps pusilla]
MASALAKSPTTRDSEHMSPTTSTRSSDQTATAAVTPPKKHASHESGRRSDDDEMASSVASASSVTSPPYWLTTHNHQRNRSADSILPAGAITLQDNETSEHDDRNNACWAKSVDIVDYTVVNGGATSVGAFVVWNVRVETLNRSYMNVRKRYSEFDDFRTKLVKTFPHFEAAVPALPPKSLISKFRPTFLEKRRIGLQYFLNCILLNPEFSGSPVLKEFLFA